MTIDSHQHFWNYEPVKHEWIDEAMSIIRRDFTPEDLQEEYQQNDVDGCVAVQADQTLEETDFLLSLSDQYAFIKGIVGWVDFRGDDISEVLERYKQYPKIKGFRHVVQGEPDHNFLLRRNFTHGISLLKQHDFTYDILVFPHQLGATLEFVKKFPNQKFVIDHIAKPYIKDGYYDGWATLMAEIAQYENVYCKVSGMVTEADYNSWTEQQLNPYMDLVFKSFGSKRVMFGSDWPVCLVAGNYDRVKGIVTNFISKLSQSEQDDIMGFNAMKFYSL